MTQSAGLSARDRNDFISIRDPRAKVLGTFLLILTLSFLPSASWLAYGLLYLLMLVVARQTAVPISQLLRRSLVAVPFFVAALALPFVVEGPALFRLPVVGWLASLPGVIQAGSLIVRSWLAVQCFLLLAMITPIHQIFWALEVLGLPALLVSIISFTHRYLFVMAAEADRMMTARQARQTGGPSVRVPLRRRIGLIGGITGSLFLRGLERSERVYAAMVGRGYDGTIRSTGRSVWGPADTLLLVAATGLCGLLLLLGWGLNT